MKRETEKLLRSWKNRARRRRVVTAMACVVALGTVAALMHPAMTLENAACTRPEHQHTQTCYTQVTTEEKQIPVCTAETGKLHVHEETCYDGEGVLCCGEADFVLHRHDAACYDGNGALWCPLPENEAHCHSQACFPEGETQPMYNTVDAALLLVDAVWQYYTRTQDADFVKEAYPVLERVVENYKKGTDHCISMDTDGLIRAGGGLDQVTWMYVRVNDILPTPRHGKPVEINAYWYNALCIMEKFAVLQGLDGAAYGALAAQVKESFVKTFYMEDKGYLKDVISGTYNDEQLRCNQIWAVSMPFTMLSAEQEKSVVDTVRRHLYTPCGLRTLSPEDPEYHPHYGGDMVSRDMAYHQGTTWVFPMGAYYLAYLKTYGKEAAGYVRSQLEALEPMLREGCVGQLPEIYEGDFPTESKGCFGQAWSVGEMLRVFEAIEKN